RRDGLMRDEAGRDRAREPAGTSPVPGAVEAADARRLPCAIGGAARTALAAELSSVFGTLGSERLLRTYGRLAEALLAAARARPELASTAAPGAVILRAELVRALEEEWAASLVDVL